MQEQYKGTESLFGSGGCCKGWCSRLVKVAVLDHLGLLWFAGKLMLTLRSMKKSKVRDRMNLTFGKDAW